MFLHSPEFPVMEAREKKLIQLKFAICLNKIIASYKEEAKKNKVNGTKDHKLINSLRKLEAASGISFPIIQNISKGIKNPALTTIIAIADGLDITPGQFFSYFDEVTEDEVRVAIAKNKKTRH